MPVGLLSAGSRDSRIPAKAETARLPIKVVGISQKTLFRPPQSIPSGRTALSATHTTKKKENPMTSPHN
ncbi:hypothetical protein, partial [Xenorhabdus bovienii]|uniref:hypothetical protein n=1 Tax=Xenorhabdus bovienii TaxID=40576 RepID=UPI001E371E4C